MSSRFELAFVPIQGLAIVDRRIMGDERGYLERIYCENDLGPVLNGKRIVQINYTFTSRVATVRGMHFQRAPSQEIKLVTCLRGEVYDVAVDLRSNSPTFLKWHAQVLSEKNHKTFVIPEGFAHGFQTLTDNCEMLYLHTAFYDRNAEGGVNATDPQLNIYWPLSVGERSVRDIEHPCINNEFRGI